MMKTRSQRPSSISTNRKTRHLRARPSVDSPFAPSLTPSSADSDFPRLHKYHAPKDKTWWPSQHPIMSPEPAAPTLLKAPRKNSDPTYRPRRNTSTSSAEGLKAATEALRRRTRPGSVRKKSAGGKKRKASHTGEDASAGVGGNTKGKHCVGKNGTITVSKTEVKSKPSSPKRTDIKFKSPNYNHTHVHNNMRYGGLGSNVMTLEQLRDSPRSPKNRRPYAIKGRVGSKDLEATMTPVPEEPKGSPTKYLHRGGIKDARSRRPSAAEAVDRIALAEKRNSFERRNGYGMRLGSFNSMGMRTPTTSPRSIRFEKRRLSSFVGEEEVVAPIGKRARRNGLDLTVTDEEIDALYDTFGQEMHRVAEDPTRLTLGDVGPLFRYLTTHIHDFANVHFGFTLTQEQQAAWPLHKLSTRYLPLMLISQYIGDGSQYGWQNFFTNSASRASLVAGIIGEWVKQRAVNHTSFGMSNSQIEILENMDREYLHHDAFLRSKKRAAMIQDMLKQDPAGCATSLNKAVDDLAEELMIVMMPLMPESIFAYSESGYFWEDTSSRGAITARQIIKNDLMRIVRMSADLHRGIRVLGRDGTVVRIANAVQKGETYYDSAPFEVINEKMVDETKHHGLKANSLNSEEGRLKIKMTTFCRIEAYVPHGPDYEEMVETENEVKKGLKEGEKIDWDEVQAQVGFWPELPEDVVREQERKGAKINEKGEVQIKRMHGSYVMIYPRLAPHQVYCEWSPPTKQKKIDFKRDEKGKVAKIVEVDDDDEEEEKTEEVYDLKKRLTTREQQANSVYGEPIPKKQQLSLKAAVEAARAEAGWTTTLENGLRNAWNLTCRLEPYAEWAATIWFTYHWYQNGAAPGYHFVKDLKLHTAEGWTKLGTSAQIKMLGLSEKALKQVYKLMGGIEDVGKQGQKITKEAIKEVRKEKVATTTVHGVVPKTG